MRTCDVLQLIVSDNNNINGENHVNDSRTD